LRDEALQVECVLVYNMYVVLKRDRITLEGHLLKSLLAIASLQQNISHISLIWLFSVVHLVCLGQ